MVIFYCFNVLKNANVRPLVSQKGPLFPTGNDIDRMHRIGKPKNNGKPRPVIIKLVRYNCRKKVFFLEKVVKGFGCVNNGELDCIPYEETN